MSLPLHTYQLPNGLRVLLREAHTAPVTTTWIWYRVGSRNETPGQTGLSHWVEHMMFKGSPQFPKGAIMRAVNRLGGYVNAFTSNDFTAYFATLPSEHAELALRIEADRMTGALFEQDEVEAERTVVVAEREGSENEPLFALIEAVTAAAFGVHPYRHQTIGWKDDLRTITREALYAHYRRYYVPNNATLIVVGDFDSAAQMERIERYLGDIPAGPAPEQRVPPEPPQEAERRVAVRMPGSAPMLRVAQHAPPVRHADFLPLVVADAVLSGGKAMFAFGDSMARSARLYRALVETQLATNAGSHYHPSLDPYLFSLGATVRDGRAPEEVETALVAEIERLRNEPVEERELAVAIRQTQAQFAYNSEGVSDQALTLGFLDVVDQPARMDTLLDELARVRPADVLRVAATYLGAENRVVGWFHPTREGGTPDDGAESPPAWAPRSLGLVCGYRERSGGSISPETVTRTTFDNGLTLLVQENPASQTVYVTGSVQAGAARDEPARPGLANLTSAMLRRGTERHSFQELNLALDSVGASLNTDADHDDAGIGGKALAEDFDLLMDLLAELLTSPSFPELELGKLRGQYLTHLGILETDTSYHADRAFMEALYPPEHPYARPVMGHKAVLAELGVSDLRAFYQAHYGPRGAILTVVGAVQPQRVVDKVAATLGGWRPAQAGRAPRIPTVSTPPEAITKRVNIPGKAQADLLMGVIGMARSAPDYYAAQVANLILGRLGLMGRLGENVRDTQGLAYYVTSNMSAGHAQEPWTILAGVNPQHVERAVAAIVGEVERMRQELVHDQELEDAHAYLTGVLPLYLETNEGIAGFLLNLEEYNLGLDYLQRYPTIIRGVDKEAVRSVVGRYLTGSYVLAIAGTL